MKNENIIQLYKVNRVFFLLYFKKEHLKNRYSNSYERFMFK